MKDTAVIRILFGLNVSCVIARDESFVRAWPKAREPLEPRTKVVPAGNEPLAAA